MQATILNHLIWHPYTLETKISKFRKGFNLFGSKAKGNYKKGSDIDLAIKGENCSPALALHIQGFINEELPVPYMVDVIDYTSLTHKELKEHIDRVGLTFYTRDGTINH